MRIRRTAGVLALAGATVGAMVLSGCSGTGKEDSGAGGASGSSGGGSTDLTIAVISHGAAGDSFWDVVKSGADRAGSDLGITVDYNSDADPTRQSELIDNAVTQKVDGIVVSMANPDGLEDSVKAAVAAGIPVVTINSGADESAAFGAIAHVGQDETVAGQAVGTRLKDAGQTGKVLCVIHEAGNVGLESRCAGVADTYDGQVENLQVDGTDSAQITDTLQSKLQSDPSVTGVVTLNGQVATAAVQAQQQAGTKAEIDTFDLSSDVITAIQAGTLGFAVDQQPWLQGYLGVQLAYLYDINGNVVGGGKPVLSGPAFVDRSNADKVAQYAQNGTR